MVVGVGLIGAGIWAREEHLPAIQASEHLSLKAVYSRSARSSKTIANLVPGIEVYSDDSKQTYSDLLGHSDIEAVVIALPISHQKHYIRSALLAGKHVLSEKPVAENLDEACRLIKWYRSDPQVKSCWHVAENWRFLNSVNIARDEASKLGRTLGFRVQIYDNIQKGWKFFETDWRKDPAHQGGFLLDGGVHYVAGLRRLLESQAMNNVQQVSAFTNLLQEHLPPVDTINAILRLESGVGGTYQHSVGTTLFGSEWTIACENGVVTVVDSEVTIVSNGETKVKAISDERTGVPPEVREWAKAISNRSNVEDLEPEEALADLELLELMLRSGRDDGRPMSCRHQIVEKK